MQQFSKLKPGTGSNNKNKEPILYQDNNLKIISFEDWSILKEKDAVCCIPYLIETNQIILRYEYVPTFKLVDGKDYHLTLVCGGVEEGETKEKALIRELEEEAGIVLRDDYKPEQLNPLFISKGHANKYYPYIIPLNEKDYHEVIPSTDGSNAEKISKSVKIDAKYISSLKPSDLITDYMLLKLKEYLNLI